MKKRLFAGFAALCMAASLASAAFAETATPETARAEPPQVVEYSASDDATGFSAAAEAAPGVLPEGAKLTVVPLNETAEPEMASLLDGCAEPEAAGEYGERIAALDLAFKVQDREVEPDGTVNVTIQLPGEIAAELQQAQELTLVHRVEQDGTTTPKKVESAVFADDCTKVSFETDSFSVYEIYATVPQDADGDNSNQADTYYIEGEWNDRGVTDKTTKTNYPAAIYYLASPHGDPLSNVVSAWKPDGAESSLLIGYINIAAVNTDRGENKNITTNVSSYIVSWPDGSTGSTWTVKEGTCKLYGTDTDAFESIRDSIFSAYKDEISQETGIGVDELKESDITAITFTPRKISTGNAVRDGQNNYHIDCMISVKCKKAFTAKFWVKEPGGDYKQVDAKDYRYLDDAGTNPDYVRKTGAVDIDKPETIIKNGVTYVLKGWYPENDNGEARGNDIVTWQDVEGSDGTTYKGYKPTTKQLEDGTVNFYAEYVPMYSQVTVSKTVTGALGDKAKEFSFTLNVTDSAGNAITGGIKAKKGSNEETPNIGNGYQFTLKDGENIVFTNVPTGATVTVTENDYTGANGGYSTSYVADDRQKMQGREARLTNISAGNHTIAFTNSKDVIPDTGITLHSMPYLLVLAGVLVGGMAWMRRRKRS